MDRNRFSNIAHQNHAFRNPLSPAKLLRLTGDPVHEAEQLTQLARSEPGRSTAGRTELTRLE